jgi:hypothetical protein
MRFTPASLSLAALIFLAPSSRGESPSSEDTVRWAQEILLGSEFKNSRHVCRRWIFSPTLSAYSHDPAQHQLVRKIVAHLNQVLASTPIRHIRLLPPNDYRANIKVHFVPLSEFPQLAREAGFEYVDGNLGVFWVTWNKRHQIIRSTVLLASDKLEGNALQHFAYEEITQSLGLPNDSHRFLDSIFHAGDFRKDAPISITDRDIRLIQLLFTHLRAGDTANAVAQAINTHWRDVALDTSAPAGPGASEDALSPPSAH